MDETSKTKKIWGPVERSVLQGAGIDIGCGPDPVFPDVRKFDVTDGDANRITDFVREQFDFVYSSHCLEHMREPRRAILDWWKLVKPGGHLIFIVPDEDLYEQGVFPSRFNPEHQATFTLSKKQSWSPVSINVVDLVHSLPKSELVSLAVQDHGYDRRLLRHGPDVKIGGLLRLVFRAYVSWRWRGYFQIPVLETWRARYLAVDQTLLHGALAQIQCIVRKLA